jgi:hypothetical protein
MVTPVGATVEDVAYETPWRRDHPRRACIGFSGGGNHPAAGDKASEHFLEFFTATIRNENTRAAYVQAAAVVRTIR